MSRDWITCAWCSHHFIVDEDADPIDLCGLCHDRVSRIIRTERTRLSSTLLAIAQEFGGPVQKALEEVAGVFGEGT